MGFLSNFLGGNNGGQQQQQPQGQQPQGQQNPQGNQQPNGGQNGKQQQGPNPSSHSQVSDTEQIADPTEIYSKMWENNTDKTEAPRLRIDGKILDEVSSKMDFMQGIPQELMQKATNGDVQSLIQMMGMVAQRSYRASVEHGSALTDSFVGQRDAFNQQATGSAVREEMLMQDLFKGKDGKPLPPYAKKQIADIAKRMQQANPDASPQEIAQSTREYMQSVANLVSGNSTPDQDERGQGQGGKAGSFDWDKWAETDAQS